MVTIALYNLKGGVGKTASAVNLAYLSAVEGKKTLLWDIDPQGSAGFYFSVSSLLKNESKKIFTEEIGLLQAAQATSYENLWVVPADLSARNADALLKNEKQPKKKLLQILQAVKKEFDVVIIDCPPGISLLHDNIFHACNHLLMPNIPTTLSVRSFETVAAYFEDHEWSLSKIKCFFSLVDLRKKLHHEILQTFYADELFLKSYIPYLSDIEKMGIHTAPIVAFAANSYAANCYKQLWNELKNILN